jgi:hypothetical protein
MVPSKIDSPIWGMSTSVGICPFHYGESKLLEQPEIINQAGGHRLAGYCLIKFRSPESRGIATGSRGIGSIAANRQGLVIPSARFWREESAVSQPEKKADSSLRSE